jgi:hypothetical protein
MAKSKRRGAMAAMALTLFTLTAVARLGAEPGNDNRAPDLEGAEKLQVPGGNKVAFWAYAEGVQIYRWNGTEWAFVGPEAVLYANGVEGEPIAIHYGGPTWESASGSKVVAAVEERATVDADSIPWLRLKATSSEGPGILDGVTYILRVNTEGGLAPTEPGGFVGEEARVPYVADYYFYRKHR